MIRITECITDAKGDRTKKPSEQDDPDAYVHVVDRSPDGVVIRGAKLHITGASFGHDLMTIPTKRMRSGEDEYSIAAMVPVNSSRCADRERRVPAQRARDDRRDQPATWDHLMFDGFVMFNDVFVPENERIACWTASRSWPRFFAHALGLWERLGGITAMVEEGDEIVGLAMLMAEANGLAKVSRQCA